MYYTNRLPHEGHDVCCCSTLHYILWYPFTYVTMLMFHYGLLQFIFCHVHFLCRLLSVSYSIVMIYYAISLLLMMMFRPFVHHKFFPDSSRNSIYAALYFLPLLIFLQATLGGVICELLCSVDLYVIIFVY